MKQTAFNTDQELHLKRYLKLAGRGETANKLRVLDSLFGAIITFGVHSSDIRDPMSCIAGMELKANDWSCPEIDIVYNPTRMARADLCGDNAQGLAYEKIFASRLLERAMEGSRLHVVNIGEIWLSVGLLGRDVSIRAAIRTRGRSDRASVIETFHDTLYGKSFVESLDYEQLLRFPKTFVNKLLMTDYNRYNKIFLNTTLPIWHAAMIDNIKGCL